MVPVKQLHSLLKLLMLCCLLGLMVQISSSPGPLMAGGMSLRQIQLQANGPIDDPFIYTYLLSGSEVESKVVLGVSKMFWRGLPQIDRLSGWSLFLQRLDQKLEITLNQCNKSNFWRLRIFLLFFEGNSLVETIYHRSLSLEDELQSPYIVLSLLKERTSRQQHAKKRSLLKSSKGQGLVKPFLMLSGLKFSENIEFEFRLKHYWQNQTHLMLQNHCKGIEQINFTLVIFKEYELLRSGLYLSVELANLQATSNSFSDSPAKINLLQGYQLKTKSDSFLTEVAESIQQESLVLRIVVGQIHCNKGIAWNVQKQRCDTECEELEYIQNFAICLSKQERLLSGCSGSSCGGTSWTVSTVTCPSTITNCITCVQISGSNNPKCDQCSSGYYKTSQGKCQACPTGCATCTSYSYSGKVVVDCTSCLSTFTMKGWIIDYCTCRSNQYMTTSTPPSCVNCPTGCSACSSSTVCSGCMAGYTFSGTLCQPCMPVCRTCSQLTSCSTCINNLIFSGTSCSCQSPLLLDSVTLSCQPCSYFDANCQTCSYDPAFSASSPTNVICSVAKQGFFVEADGSTSPCGAFCANCTSSIFCIDCLNTFPIPSGGLCSCSPLFLKGTSPQTCDTCSSIIPGCSACTDITNVTLCTACQTGFYPATPYNSPSCLACPPICDTCLDSTACSGCRSGMHLNSGTWCVCLGALQYVQPVSLTCQSCSNTILSCISCVNTFPATCTNCATGTYLSGDNLQCIPCPLNCNTCDVSGCLICNSGYTNTSGVCTCDSNCQTCLNISSNSCSACTFGVLPCTACAAGFYFSSPNCLPCLPTCQQCNDGSSCSSCSSPFILSFGLQCVCNETNGMYLSLDSSTCGSCGSVIANCLSCQVATPTFCLECTFGLYYNSGSQQCETCDYPCASCNTTSTACESCTATFSHDAGKFCYCNNVSVYYSTVTQGCVSCPELIPNCNQCSSNNTQFSATVCLACIDPFFADSSSNTCQPCNSTCSSCTASNFCTACIANLIVVGNQCQCNTTNDPNLYYSDQAGMCVSCLIVLDNCLACTPSPLNCTSCKSGTYQLGTICVNCPSNCATCDSAGCLTCPTGLNISGSDCVCGSACASCQVTAPNCLSCTLDSSGVVISCSSCQPGYQVSSSGDSCSLCPVGCDTCSGGSCTTCLATFSLLGSRCSCDSSLGLYLTLDGKACALCEEIFYGCDTCSFDGAATSCSKCQDGLYLNGTECSYCSSACATCSAVNTCASCPSGYTWDGISNCLCGPSCLSCSSSVSNCSSCILTILGAFGQCTGCYPGSFLNSSNLCQNCPSTCVTCDSNANCTSCSVTLEVINGICTCNTNQGFFLDNTTNLCVQCSSYYGNCSTCQYTPSVSFGFNCSSCLVGFYWFNNSCTQEVCGDGVISPSEDCDDGNTIGGDGCFLCRVEDNYQCTGEPSLCIVLMNFKLSFDSVSMSTTICNQLTIYFHIEPHYNSYYTANFTSMYAFHNLSKIIFKNESTYTKNYVSYKFEITDNVEGRGIGFIFIPSRLNLTETQNVPMYPIFMRIPASSNSVPIIYQGSEVCQKKEAVSTYVSAVQYTSYGVMAISTLPAKIVGLELMGVLQLSYLSLGNIDHLNPLLSSLTQLSGSNGAKLQMDQSEPTKTRRLQTTALTPSRVQSIGYTSNFIRNCNLMLFIVMIVILVSFILYAVTYCCKNCAPSLYAISKRLFKEVLLTLILFNCFNFAYCAGLHFAYADKDDDLYVLGTVAAVLTIVIPLVMMVVLQLTEEEGFGEFKDKLKRGKLERAYFMITIIYRMGIGYYIATMNQDDLSTLIVLAISLFFLLYNLVNLPFTKAYHNYRANICHLTQFICLFVALYFRSMMSGASQAQLDKIYLPVYIELGAIGLSLLVSLIVLIYEVYLWVLSVKEWCRRKDEQVHETEGDLREDKEMIKQNSNKFEISVENME